MPYKDESVKKAYHKQQSRKHYLANKAEVIAKTASKKKEFRKEWQEFKASLSCTKCGFNHPAALDFHHEDPSTKDGNVHRYVSNGQFKKVRDEIKKCIVLCANCHRIYHHEKSLIQSP